ncbi:MAG: hypothetical protein LBD01_07165 [Puniceicoccales bacterium]|jgi:hypothetical protein|nr:hypothetical protein [Puniceicoccales bacterium]
MGKQYNKIIKRRRARAYELRAKGRVQQAIATVKGTSSTARKRGKK